MRPGAGACVTEIEAEIDTPVHWRQTLALTSLPGPGSGRKRYATWLLPGLGRKQPAMRQHFCERCFHATVFVNSWKGAVRLLRNCSCRLLFNDPRIDQGTNQVDIALAAQASQPAKPRYPDILVWQHSRDCIAKTA